MVLICACANYMSRRIKERESTSTDMASALTILQSLWYAFPPKLSNPSLVSHISSLSLPKTSHDLKLKHLPRAYSEELPNELIEDSKFVPLNADDRPYGPPALLLSGFEVEDLARVRQLLKKLEGEFLEVIVCTEDMISRSLWDAMNTKQSNLEVVKIANSLPRICFLSGLTGEEMLMFIDAFPEFGIEPPVFAALVPNSADKPLQEVMEEIMGDHEMMSARQLD